MFDLLDQSSGDAWSQLIDAVLIAVILVNVSAAVLESVPEIAEKYALAFSAIEAVSVAVFTAEYLVRLWAAPENALLGRLPAWRARLVFATRLQNLVDLLTVAPVYVALLTPIDIRSLLVLRLLRFFKITRYSPGVASLVEAISAERRALTACAVILVGIVLIAASAMHFAEMDAQPDKLGTIPEAMYWAFVTLATVGYGDVVPITPLGKMVASLTAMVGIVMLALPVGILASAFADEIRRRDFVVTLAMVAKVPLFADLDATEVAAIMRFLNARSFEPGQAVVRRGEPAHSMYLIASGACEVELATGPVRLKTGDFFGEMGLLAGRERNATVTAVTRARLLALEAADLKYLMDQTPKMGERIREVAERRAEETRAKGDTADTAPEKEPAET